VVPVDADLAGNAVSSEARKVLSNLADHFRTFVAKSAKNANFHPAMNQIPKDSSMSSRLDRIDLKMLRLLQNNGRVSNAELAETAGVSAATCHRRTQRLFDEGFIARIRAMVAPRKVGLGTLVMVGVVLDRSTPESFASFEQAVAKLKCVLDCHLVAGDFDYFLKIRAGDVDDFKRIHGDQLIALPGVRQTRTFFVMKEVVDNAPLDF
jgi:Lrp/AsnC family leucine-responsive transcriptional regulator